MASTFYITAGLTAIDSVDSPPSGDNWGSKFFITAGLVANDYQARKSIKRKYTFWSRYNYFYRLRQRETIKRKRRK